MALKSPRGTDPSSATHVTVPSRTQAIVSQTAFNSADGARLQQWDCAGAANQKWQRLERLPRALSGPRIRLRRRVMMIAKTASLNAFTRSMSDRSLADAPVLTSPRPIFSVPPTEAAAGAVQGFCTAPRRPGKRNCRAISARRPG